MTISLWFSDWHTISVVLSFWVHSVRISFEHWGQVLCCDHCPDIGQVVCFLGLEYSPEILNERMHTGIDFKKRVFGVILRYDYVVSFIVFNKVLVGWYYKSVSLCIAGKIGVYSAEFLFDLDASLQLFMGPVEWPICGHDKEQMPEIPWEIFFDYSLGELVVETAPDSHVDGLFFLSETVVQKLVPSSAVAYFVVIVQYRVVESDWFGRLWRHRPRLGVANMHQCVG